MSDRPCHRGPRVPVATLAVLCGVAFGTPPALAALPDDAAAAPPAPSPDVPTVITPRPRDESTFVRVSADGLPDGVPLAEFTPDDTNRPALPDAIVTHVQAPQESHTELSLGYSSAHLTHGYGDWYGVHLRGAYQDGGRTVLGELAQLHRFGENTQLGALTYVQDLGPDWFGGIGFAGTTSGTILPSARVDLSINRKLLSDRSLVVSLGAGYAWNRSGHRDQLYHAGVIWYALPKWIFEAGTNYTVDSPGSVKAPAYYGAVTYGEVGKSVIVLRGGFGREAYQVTGSGSQIADFRSHEIDAKWRYWFTRKWGTQLEFNYYHNPYYSRIGGELSVFYRW
ncbi:YaiO family outer membrane beta-barrel protein [Burkholderia seminalis]|uniref:YaiO family outer membrane beta-barrel protein n=1 Tax=Burkholderia seminalis TaxID=488731 RepID=UPI0019069D64|nr:YaiO family outer membrane beta-barrel protein [Burkholderia seminalis]MBJ9591590.1 YaiO family outer membrane beta-barrel protein [Burkholderia seminalis]